ncbi:hypothetical protein ACRRTK_010541 [Alexandromys fortis]
MGGVNRIEFWAEEEVRSDSALLPETLQLCSLEQRHHDGRRLESSRQPVVSCGSQLHPQELRLGTSHMGGMRCWETDPAQQQNWTVPQPLRTGSGPKAMLTLQETSLTHTLKRKSSSLN